jgi:hypothetical protein
LLRRLQFAQGNQCLDGKKSGTNMLCDNDLGRFMGVGLPFNGVTMELTDCWSQRLAPEPIDVDRSRKVTFRRIARKPAPMLVPDTLTVKMTVKSDRGTWKHFEINSLEGSLIIEWE